MMHIEKNICDNMLGTVMNIEFNRRDLASTSSDLAGRGKKDLHLVNDG